jgi:glycosyltransferase involved in cell wall biosynthesis
MSANRDESKLLTISIPSYNRPEKLLATLQQLVPQMVSGVTIEVFDNGSETPYERYCIQADPDIAKSVAAGVITFFRHRYNVGMSANFMKAFEGCQAEWMWLVADDDEILPNAISLITGEIRAVQGRGDVAFIKFSSPECKNPAGAGYVRTLGQLIDILAVSVAHFDSYIFITNGLYRVGRFRDQIQIGYRAAHTYVPHLLMLIHHLNEHPGRDVIFLSDRQVASYVRPERGYSYGFVAGLGVGAFKNFDFNLTKRQYRRLEAVFAAHDDFKVALDLFYFCRHRSNLYVARRLVSNYYQQIKGARSGVHCMMFRAFGLLFFAPPLMELFVRVIQVLRPETRRHIVEMKEKYQKQIPTTRPAKPSDQ